MTYRSPLKMPLGGLLKLAAIVATAAAFVWFMRWDQPDALELKVLLALIVPVGVFWMIKYGTDGIAAIYRGTLRYQVDGDALRIRGWLASRSVFWDHVVDFALPPAKFPSAPQVLVLYEDGRRPLKLSLSLVPQEQWRADLATAFGPLKVNGYDQVRYFERATPSLWKMRWQRHAGHLAGLFYLPLLLLATVWACCTSVQDNANYRKIRAHHQTAAGSVVAIETRKDYVWATVRFEPSGGGKISVRRKAAPDFSKSHPRGSQVTVEYLPAKPWIARIAGDDLDDYGLYALVLYVPFAWMLFYMTKESFGKWFGPLGVSFPWTLEQEADHIQLRFKRVSMETLHAIMPQRHDGTMLISRLFRDGEGASRGGNTLTKIFAPAGIAATRSDTDYAILEKPEAARLLSRLGYEETAWANYISAGDIDAAAANRLALEYTAPANPDESRAALAQCRLIHENGKVWPLDRSELPEIFCRLIDLQLARLYGFAPPAQLAGHDWPAVLKMDATEGTHRLLVERDSKSASIWVAAARAKVGQCVKFEAGRWTLSAERKLPGRMREHKSKLVDALLAPLVWVMTVLALLILLLFSPLLLRDARRREQRLKAARAAAGIGNGK